MERDFKKRDSFQNKIGFILACVGSAVGMGNIWLFPYRVGEFGGAAFLFPYLFFVLLLGLTGVSGEMAFGRAMKSGPLGAFRKALERRGKKYGDVLAFVPVLGSLGIAIGYAVVVAWILKYTVQSFTGVLHGVEDYVELFSSVTTRYSTLGWHFAIILFSLFIMTAGIQRGIEKINRVFMPLFFLLFCVLAIRVFFLEDSTIGYQFLWKADFEKMFQIKTWIFALGQAFFSLSLAGSGTVVYGSYLKEDVDVLNSSLHVSFYDTLAAILAALVIIPAVFSFGMEVSAGPGLMFLAMPRVFQQMPFGRIFSCIFFSAVFLAGMTSLVNLFESSIEALQEKFSLERWKAVSIVMGLSFCLGILVEDATYLGKLMDMVSIYFIPLGAFLSAVLFYWICGDDFVREEIQKGREAAFPRFLLLMGKYVFCGISFIVFILGILYHGIG
ncbi:sodium-dependent tryptophan transporter [Fusobacterium necrophorum subsp. funduliforme]|uniref:Sodium-dependent tryptophan transporter n=1 Tax=Fusobacterium necrophorum subsp. funduliforme TaxID=143387 RepID=A0A162JHE3_9FUSO|nr:sodium-dependent transporter [Fusobacterium necrophorum]KYL05764.1 sodium-dependent tryptophan transporter [Fusobacterium necrophorum subsp. funduliforme]KYM45517.1 sodium-dependent tryptophan transporter [Fusobacterium necrophorum subsp. funduliforme]KYM60807.1 sodium-dependent tryptophan transporter [Fusobacterium necrophorum subsp. funduliforme]KYM66475.1 sodium-dependent tryptophan transporter [Fusobacterium necrophorum subsp. funduliforme]MDK4487823.1 sodium-dependent transporter [Fuso